MVKVYDKHIDGGVRIYDTKKDFLDDILDGFYCDTSDAEKAYPYDKMAQAVMTYVQGDESVKIVCGRKTYCYRNGKYVVVDGDGAERAM